VSTVEAFVDTSAECGARSALSRSSARATRLQPRGSLPGAQQHASFALTVAGVTLDGRDGAPHRLVMSSGSGASALVAGSVERKAAMSTIHQEAAFSVPPSRIYEVLTDLKQFSLATGAPARGESNEGGAFTAFGDHITGRHLELVPGRRVVQAWRAKTWPEGVHSIVRFELLADGTGTRLVFDHEGFPEAEKEHLSSGWRSMYWEKIAKHVG
jgi:activator of HSP90 ATPase